MSLGLCRAPSYSTSVLIDGEDARHFVVGLAMNIGLENNRAARMVSAAVAARTRACFLQAWVGLLLLILRCPMISCLIRSHLKFPSCSFTVLHHYK